MGGIYGINMCTKCLRKTNELDRYNQCNSCAITRNQSNSSPSYKRLSYIDYTPWYETGLVMVLVDRFFQLLVFMDYINDTQISYGISLVSNYYKVISIIV